MQGVWHIPHIYFTPFVSKYLIYLTSGQPWNTIVIIPYVCCFWHSSLPMLIATMNNLAVGMVGDCADTLDYTNCWICRNMPSGYTDARPI